MLGTTCMQGSDDGSSGDRGDSGGIDYNRNTPNTHKQTPHIHITMFSAQCIYNIYIIYL